MVHKQEVWPPKEHAHLHILETTNDFVASSRHQMWKRHKKQQFATIFHLFQVPTWYANVKTWNFEVSFQFLWYSKIAQETLVKQHWLNDGEIYAQEVFKSYWKCKISCTNMWWEYHIWYIVLALLGNMSLVH